MWDRLRDLFINYIIDYILKKYSSLIRVLILQKIKENRACPVSFRYKQWSKLTSNVQTMR